MIKENNMVFPRFHPTTRDLYCKSMHWLVLLRCLASAFPKQIANPNPVNSQVHLPIRQVPMQLANDHPMTNEQNEQQKNNDQQENNHWPSSLMLVFPRFMAQPSLSNYNA